MSKTFCFGAVALPLMISLFSATMMAQGTVPSDPAQTPTQEQPPANPAGRGASSTTTVAPSQPPPPKEPYVLDDGGLYIEPLYWLNKEQPRVRGGKIATAPADFDYLGNAKAAIGVEIGIPAGRSNTLRISGFRVQGNSGSTLAKEATIIGQDYPAGTVINATYKLQAAKVSWDYLSYSWHKPTTTVRLKTLYEVQYVTTKIFTAAPFLPTSTSASGTVNDNTASGSKSVVLPTFGMALGSDLGKYFRWDIRGSGFGLPKRSVIGDVEGTFAIRLGRLEILAGERLFYFKTSPRADLYVRDMLQGVYGGIRYSWKGNL